MRVKGAFFFQGFLPLRSRANCDSGALVGEPTYPVDAPFALALTDNCGKNHDVAEVVKLDLGGAVRENLVVPKLLDSPPVLSRTR